MLISCAVTAQLICAFVFLHAKIRFSHEEAQLIVRFYSLTYSVDATNNIFDIASMVNDAKRGSPKENTCVQVVMVEKLPHLCIFAAKYISIGEELRYDYGIADLPWRKNVNI